MKKDKSKTKKLFTTFEDKAKKGIDKPIMPAESPKERQIAGDAYNLFATWRDNRNQRFSLLGDMNLTEYIDESVYRYVTSVYERDDMEDWQSRANVPVTRNKINNISGRAIQSMPIGQVRINGTGKFFRKQLINNLYEFSEDASQYALLMSEAITEAMVKGTVVLFEGHSEDVHLDRTVTSNGEKVKKTVKQKLYSQIVQLEDFYPSTVFVDSIDKMSGAAWREILPLAEFKVKYGNFEKASCIPGYWGSYKDDFPSYRDDQSLVLGDGLVEVIHIFKKDTDEYIILANGFWINPIVTGEGDEAMYVSPNPFPHKRLPFFSFKFEPLSSGFFYGKSMPDKLRESQDQLNVMTNMVFDQSVMALFAPIITSSTDYIEDDFLRPGRRIAIDTQGKSIDQSIKTLEIRPPSGWYQYVLEYTKRSIDDASVDNLSQGSVAGTPDRMTAEAVRTAAAGIASSLSYFGLQIQEGIKQKMKLRVPNMLKIYFDPKNPIVKKITGEDVEKINGAFNEFTIENTELSPDRTGKIRRGKKIIEMYSSKSEMPTAPDLQARALVEETLSGEKVEIVAIPSDYLKEMFEFDVAVVADKRLESNKATEQAVVMYKAQTYMQLFPDLIDRYELAAEVMEQMGDDPSRLLLSLDEQKQQAQQQQMNQLGQGQQGGVPGGVGNNLGNNITQQVAGAAQRI